ncbi:MAG: hypothetical protein AAF620_04615 [Bacteroidota bacterium]
MKNLNSKKIGKSISRLSLLLLAFISSTFTACENDEDQVANNGEEAESAWIRGLVNYTLDGAVWYMDVNESVNETFDISASVELGADAEVYSVGEHPFTISRDSKTITKWKVDKTTMEITVDAIISYATTGLNDVGRVIFFSETQGFLHDLGEGLILEFNPSSMEISRTHNVPPKPEYDDFSIISFTAFVYNGKIIYPLINAPIQCCEYNQQLNATVGVFDPNTGDFGYSIDERGFTVGFEVNVDENNTAYLGSADVGTFTYKHLNIDTATFPNHLAIYKLQENGEFDPTFELNLEEYIPDITLFRYSSFVLEDKMAFIYSALPYEDYGSFDDRWSDRNRNNKSVLLDLNTGETTQFSSFDNYNDGVIFLRTIGGVNYFSGYRREGEESYSYLLKQNSIDDYSVISTTTSGGFEHINKLW